MGTLTKSEEPDEMQHNAAFCISSGSALFAKIIGALLKFKFSKKLTSSS